MQVEQSRWTLSKGWVDVQSNLATTADAQLVFLFLDPDCLMNKAAISELQSRYPNACIVGGSSAGNVYGAEVNDDDMVATAVYFEKSEIQVKYLVADNDHLVTQAAEVATSMKRDDLQHLLVLSDGLTVNGSELAKGVNVLEDVSITGGLMGDKGRFNETFIMVDGVAHKNSVVFVGFYGNELDVRYGCFAGWDEFGVDRVITKSKGNVVYEIDGQPALELYKSYLGDFSQELPISGLRFPLSIRVSNEQMLIRTLLAVDEEEQSLTFAGDVPEGSMTLLMKGNTESLIEGARKAATQAKGGRNTGFAIVISCVGRRLLMGQMVEEELDVVQEELGENTIVSGFYSYGELAPYSDQFYQSELHNQTMTLLAVYENE